MNLEIKTLVGKIEVGNNGLSWKAKNEVGKIASLYDMKTTISKSCPK